MSRIINVVSAAVLCIVGTFGQSNTAPAFEVASVRQAQPPEGGGLAALRETITPGRGSLTMRNVTLASAIQWAYTIQPAELSGPDWLKDRRFDIVGKADAATSPDQLRLMLQALLADRFKLTVRRQSKELSALILSTGKGAHKLQPVVGSDDGRMTGAAMSFEVHQMTISRLATILSSVARVPVIDRTGLDGHYDFKLDLRPYITARQPGDPPLNLAEIAITAVREQLGLKLESQKMPIDVLVVDHVERDPTEN